MPFSPLLGLSHPRLPYVMRPACVLLCLLLGSAGVFVLSRPFPVHAAAPKARAKVSPAWKAFHRLVKKWTALPLLRKARVGIAVSTTDGKLLYAHHPDKAFFPASNTKLFTLAAVLTNLGANYRYVTKIYGDRPIDRRGVLRGNLYIQGSGDPLLRSEELWRLSRNLYNLGLRKITGRVVFDDTVFDRQRFGAGWRHHKHQWYRPYLAPIGGLSLNYNAIGIVVQPGRKPGGRARVNVDPPSRYIARIVNSTRTVRRGRFRVKFKVLSRRGFRDTIVIKGRVPWSASPRTYWRRVNHPGWYTAFSFAEALRDQRIRVSRWPRRKTVPGRATLLYKHRSVPLRSILQYTGKFSSNFATEQLLKTLGGQLYGAPGTWPKGLRAVQTFLASLGIAKGSYRMINGSGLGRLNRFSPRQLVTLLQRMYRDFSTRPEFLLAQPTAGRDGTLRRRFRQSQASGRMRAKTGTIDGISTLSGYVATQNKKVLVFSFCMNSEKAHVVKIGRRLRRYLQRQTRLFRRFQDALGEMLARYPRFAQTP